MTHLAECGWRDVPQHLGQYVQQQGDLTLEGALLRGRGC
jgi:hypothetical protein